MNNKPVKILGKTFNIKEEADKYYKADLKKRLPELKHIEGFPIGEDEDILALSNPPFYTACPNPYINDFITEFGKPYDEKTDDYHCEPFVGDVSEGKGDAIYTAHGYHTKVPYKAIVKYIEHYTKIGDVIFDGFCGTGMTGLAAQSIKRKSIISDLSPLATFISRVYNSFVDSSVFESDAKKLLVSVMDECSWLYETQHTSQKDLKSQQLNIHSNEEKAIINFTVWSDVFNCPYCSNEIIFYDVAVDKESGSVSKVFNCSHCKAELKKTDCDRVFENKSDIVLDENISVSKQIPVLINYTFKGNVFQKKPDTNDFKVIEKVESMDIPYWFPSNRIPKGDKTGEPIRIGITHMHHFYTKRNLWVLASVFDKLNKTENLNKRYLRFAFEQAVLGFAKIARYVPTHYSQVNQYLSGTLYIGSQVVEVSLLYILKGKINRLIKTFDVLKSNLDSNVLVTNQSATDLKNIKNDSIDYIFTDPPFGDNLMYSELNFLHESWMKIWTNDNEEAIINKTQNKKLDDYGQLMFSAFQEYYRILKPKRWITVEFHNSKSSIWNVIQESLIKSGFIVAKVAILDKKQGSFNQVVATGATKSDLVISAYKPSKRFEEKFLKNAGEGLELDFIQEFLHQQPIHPILERTEKMLYSKMLSYYIQHAYEVRYDAKAFYQLLRENFAEEDGFWFNAGQINSYIEYKKKMKLEGMNEIKQGLMMIFVTDEKSALVWLHNFLSEPKTFSDIHTAFTQLANIQGDAMPELMELLEQNFIPENGLYRRPKTDPEHNLIIEKREKQLMRQFESLLIQAQTEKKKIKTIRKEAVQLGFETCYKEKRFQDILTLAAKLDKKILEESGELKEFVDAAEISIGGLS